MNKKDLTPIEQELLSSLNKKALLIVKAEEFLKESKIPFNTALFDSMSDTELESFVETWNPENQKALRAKYVSNETNEDN